MSWIDTKPQPAVAVMLPVLPRMLEGGTGILGRPSNVSVSMSPDSLPRKPARAIAGAPATVPPESSVSPKKVIGTAKAALAASKAVPARASRRHTAHTAEFTLAGRRNG
jgi:hypothetical protein